MPSEDLVSRRMPWRAALLGAVTTGLGQLYAGRPFRAIILHLLSGCVGIICLAGFFIPCQPWNIIVPLACFLLILLFVLADAIRCAAKTPRDYRLRAFNRWYIYLLCVALAGLEGNVTKALITTGFVQAFKIPTQSMAPTLVVGDRLLVDKFTFASPTGALARLLPCRKPRRGDLVIFNLALADGVTQPGEKFVKRVIGVQGDRVRIVHRQVAVNGRPLDEPYVRHEPAFADELRPGDDFPPGDPADPVAATSPWSAEMGSVVKDGELIVPPGKYFVLGDNREQSWDSRFWGFVPQNDIIGKPDLIYFSWDAKAHHVQWGRIGEILK